MTPSLILAIPALLAALLALLLIGRNRRSVGLARFLRVFSGLGLLLIALVLGVLALAIHNYSRLHTDVAVARIALKQVGPQRFTATLIPEAANARVFELQGDQWEVDARVVRWQMPARLAGVPPLYRLERISGRYIDIDKEREATRSLYDLAEPGALDLWTLKRQFPKWLPFVDADFGSGAYLPMVDGGRFDLSLSPDGGLVAKPADQTTRDKLREMHW